MKKLTRREVLQLAGAGLTAFLPGPALSGSVLDTLAPLSDRLAALFRHTASASAIGRHYLALAPSEADARLLTALVSGTAENYRRLMRANSRQLRGLLSAQQRQDFACGQTVTIDGWVLSATEARVCAIAALKGKVPDA